MIDGNKLASLAMPELFGLTFIAGSMNVFLQEDAPMSRVPAKIKECIN
jgi:hypothetical protein